MTYCTNGSGDSLISCLIRTTSKIDINSIFQNSLSFLVFSFLFSFWIQKRICSPKGDDFSPFASRTKNTHRHWVKGALRTKSFLLLRYLLYAKKFFAP